MAKEGRREHSNYVRELLELVRISRVSKYHFARESRSTDQNERVMFAVLIIPVPRLSSPSPGRFLIPVNSEKKLRYGGSKNENGKGGKGKTSRSLS